MKRQSCARPGRRPATQRGATLFVALVMLIMITLLVVSAFRVSNTNLKVVASMQGQQEAIGAAQAAIEQTLSTPGFAEDPDIVAASAIAIDINGAGGTPEYTVMMTPKPACIRSRIVTPAELDPANLADRPCIGSARQGAGAMASFCSNTIWEVSATTKDNVTGAETAVRQGVSLRVAATDALTYCK